MFSIFWSSSLFLWIRATSSIHSRHPCIWLSPIFVIPVFSSLISLAISCMRFAYSITDSTPPLSDAVFDFYRSVFSEFGSDFCG